jgi:hypothetical protein
MGLLELAKTPIEVKKLEIKQREMPVRHAKDLIDKGYTPEQAKDILAMKY